MQMQWIKSFSSPLEGEVDSPEARTEGWKAVKGRDRVGV